VKRVYTIIITDEDKGIKMSRENKGFTIFELLGFAEKIKLDLYTQMLSMDKNSIEVTRRYDTGKSRGEIIIKEDDDGAKESPYE